MITTGRIIEYSGNRIIVECHDSVEREINQKKIAEVELRLDDGRTISAAQRRKIFALIRDIATTVNQFFDSCCYLGETVGFKDIHKLSVFIWHECTVEKRVVNNDWNPLVCLWLRMEKQFSNFFDFIKIGMFLHFS